ncbi:MAG: nucleotidyltransferase domain-containing protein [Actinomycetota bacterium]|nr:nucleotidyltransferase domain-containing protein [Actinomycetota bacterium]
MVSGARQTSRPAPPLALLREHRDEILRLAEKRGVSNIRIFGSVARGDATPDSDIDLLVDLEARESGFDLVAFEMDLEAPPGPGDAKVPPPRQPARPGGPRMPARRHFGSVRRLPSGRYQASYWHLARAPRRP